MPLGAQGTGIANIAIDGTVLDTWFPSPSLIDGPLDAPSGTHRVSARDLSDRFLNLVGMDHDRLVELVPVQTRIADLSEPPVDAHDVYLRLHLLSHRLVRPGEINMHDCLEHLVPVVWTNKGPCLSDNFEYIRTNLRSRGMIQVWSIEPLPRMVDYVVPSGVAIAEAERVRLGAYLAPGTSVVREGFVSHNAGSLGPAKIEGRMSSSVTVGEGTKIALSANVMADEGEGRNRLPLHIGRDCVLRHSAGLIGVDLGDNCEVGLNVVLAPETVVFDARVGEQVKARELSGQNDLLIAHEPFSNSPVVRTRPQRGTDLREP
ncbi:succinyltransferase [Corynebacterium glaucum]|uniref:succinyltransferase n=1 Tax=Corynebacterium glaucum TaxID=187491 RepID=UPI0025B6280D|nr:succinyltransferase [Corynebacterium glaucum]WJZ07455.1 2,3,4,5-tetrahydropyridine-2,6-dicarboxylate N-succinyltransferase [Corynebacterium glaucum]